MANVDDKVVSMSFESSKFESGVTNTISALDKLKAALHFPNAGKGLDDINASAKKVDLSHIASGVDDIKGKLGALSVAALAVFANIAQKAVSAGIAFAKSFTIDPIKQGFQEYTTNLNAIQTILANTQAAGTNLKQVNAALNELNHYSDKTIYNFSEMAKNIGTFTAAGVDLKTSTAAIKGIGNLAALSGSNSQQASSAMYQLSQAIAGGTVRLQDWISVRNASMGGAVFQRALTNTAVAMGTLDKSMVSISGSMKNVKINGTDFAHALDLKGKNGKGTWLTSDVLTKTLAQFTGDLKDSQLAAEGFNGAQIASIQQTARAAMLAATEVKTLGAVLDVAKETAGSGWATTWQIIFGNFTEAKKTFTNLSNAVDNVINANAAARNQILASWKALGGRTVLIDAISTAFKNLGLILKPIKEAFRDIFPATTGKQLFELTKRFQDFTESLKPSPATVEGLRSTFRGLFAVLDIGKQVISGIFTMFGELFGALHKGSGNFLEVTGGVGDFLVALDKALKKGNQIHDFFAGLGHVIAAPLQLLSALAKAVSDMFSGFSPGGFFGQMDGMSKAMTPFQKVMEGVATVWNKFLDGVSNSGKVLKPAVDEIVKLVEGLGTAIGNAASGMNFDAILQVVRTGLFGALVLMAKNFFGSGSFVKQLTQGFSGGIFSNFSKSFGTLQGSLVSMQNNVKADTLQKIAIAVGVLTASVVALSFVDSKKLSASLSAMTIAFGELLGGMAILTMVTKTAGFIKMPLISASLIMLAGALDLLSIAVIALGHLSWEQLIKGLTGTAALLGIIATAAIPLSASSGGLTRAGIGITAIAIALNLLALAMHNFGNMSWTEMGKGLAGVAGGLILLAGAAKAMPTGMVAQGAGLIAMAVGLKILAGVVQTFSGMDWKAMGKGLAGVGGSLLIIAGAMQLMPSNMVLTAAGLLLVSVALGKIADAVIKMSGMSITQIAKGLGTLAGSLLILAAALYAMSGTLAGAAALGIAAAAISLLAPAISSLGKQSWTEILKGLITLGAALTILGIAGALVTPVIPSLLGLGVALVLIGGGLALAGAGIFLISTGLSALAVALPTGVGVIVAALNNLLKAIPEMIKNLMIGLLQIVDQLAATAPKFVDALVKILDSLVQVVIQASPKIAVAMDALLAMLLKVFNDNEPKIIQAGFNLILALLNGIKNNIHQVVNTVVNVVTTFLTAIAGKLGDIVRAGTNILVKLLSGIANNIQTVVLAAGSIITKFVSGITTGLVNIAKAGLSILTKLLNTIANNLGNAIAAGANIVIAVVTGIGNAGVRIVTAAREAAGKFITNLANQIVKLADQVFKAMIALINGLATTIETNSGPLRAAGVHLGVAIIEGMTGGLTSAAGDMFKKAEGIAQKALSILKKPWSVLSPSKTMHELGTNIILGMANGLDATAPQAYSSAEAVSLGVIKAFNDTFQTASPSKVMQQIGQFVGQGFAQGLKGSSDDIRNAFSDLHQKLKDDIASMRDDISSEQDKLNSILDEKQTKLKEINDKKWKNETEKARAIADVQQQYAKSIKESEDAIRSNEATLSTLVGTQKTLTKGLQDEKNHLIQLTDELDKVNQRLKDARDNLAAIIKERDDFAEQQRQAYDSPPEISKPLTDEIKSARDNIATEQGKLNALLGAGVQDIQAIADARKSLADAQGSLDELVQGKILTGDGSSVDVVATYLQDLNAQQTAVAAYGKTLEQLRALNLDDKTYRMLVESGVADQGFAEALLAGGKTAVTGLNKLDGQLDITAQTLGTDSAAYLYREGIKTAQGLIDGLVNGMADTKGQTKLTNQVNALAKLIIATMRKSLRSKSPSQEFAEIGMDSMEGLSIGFSNGTKMVTDAVDQAAKDALFAMKKSMGDISTAITDEIDPQPVITPILDLTQVRSQASELSSLTTPIPITAAASYGQAAIISSGQTNSQDEPVPVAPGGTSVKFEQNNYSPESLTEIEIYRQTKNQLSQLKSALAVT